MANEIELWKFIQDEIHKNGTAVYCKVVQAEGSSPGRPGFSMAVNAAGEIRGTIGGGIMEYNMIQEAIKTIANESLTTELKVQRHKKNVLHSSGLLCSGTQLIGFVRLGESSFPQVKKIIANLKDRVDGILEISDSKFDYTEPADNTFGLREFKQEGEQWQYRELYGRPDTAYIIGGGHVGLALSKVMSAIGYYVVIFDPRKEVPTILNNVYADEIIICDFSEVGSYIEGGLKSYAMIVSADRVSDSIALKSILNKQFRYVGAMGSKSKIDFIMRELRNAGFSREQMNAIHAPIGLKINSETVDEIAISVAAQIIQVRNANA
jgi:xanthine dehydrogenase accessory factor